MKGLLSVILLLVFLAPVPVHADTTLVVHLGFGTGCIEETISEEYLIVYLANSWDLGPCAGDAGFSLIHKDEGGVCFQKIIFTFEAFSYINQGWQAGGCPSRNQKYSCRNPIKNNPWYLWRHNCVSVKPLGIDPQALFP